MVSNIFYFYPEPWGSDPIWLAHIFLDGLVQPPTRVNEFSWNAVSIPIPSMLGIFTYIYHKNQPVGVATSPSGGRRKIFPTWILWICFPCILYPRGFHWQPKIPKGSYHHSDGEFSGFCDRAASVQSPMSPIRKKSTLPQTNMAPENWWWEDEFPFGKPYFQVLC